MPRIVIDTLNLEQAERLLCIEALCAAGSIVEAAQLLGISRNALRKKIIRHKIEWPRAAVSKEVAA